MSVENVLFNYFLAFVFPVTSFSGADIKLSCLSILQYLCSLNCKSQSEAALLHSKANMLAQKTENIYCRYNLVDSMSGLLKKSRIRETTTLDRCG